MSRRRRWALAAAVGLGIVVVLGGAAAFRLGDASRHLRRAESQLDVASTALDEGRLAEARVALGVARAELLAANNGLYNSPELDLLGGLPVVRQNLDSLQDSVGLASQIVSGGEQILVASVPLESAEGRLEVSLSDGSIPLDAVRTAGERAAELAIELPSVPPAETDDLLLSPTREVRDEVYEQAVRRRAQLDVLGRGLTMLQHLAGGDGPRRYLLAIANTAEMRGSGGMVLSYGVLEGADGTIDLTDFGRIDELELQAALPEGVPPLPEDYLDRWSGFEPTRLWRNANLAGDFTIVAPVLEAMYTQASGLPVDGVIQVDPQGLAAVLAGVGPVTVPELGEVTADNVVGLVLHEAYLRFPGIDERSDVLGDVAEAAFQRLVDGDFPSLRPLATELVEAVDGRHLLVHSRAPRVDDAGAFFDATGELPPVDHLDTAHLTVQNVSANKLDYYLDTELHLRGERSVGELGTLEAEIVLTNTAPPGATEPPYVFGPFNEQQEAGLYRGIVTLYLPTGTSLDGDEGGPLTGEPIVQTEGGRTLVSFTIDVPAGQERRILLDLRLAPVSSAEPYSLVLVPSPRVRPTQAVVDITTDDGPVEAQIVLDRTVSLFPGGRTLSGG